MNDDSTADSSTPKRSRRAVLAGLAGLTVGSVTVGAQGTTTDGGTTDGGTTTNGTATTGAETTGAETTGEETTGGETVAEAGTAFRVRIENVSPEDALTPSEGEPQPVLLSPGVFAVHTERGPLFTPGEQDRGEGLEAIAEDGVPTELAESLDSQSNISASGAFDTPDGASEPSPIGPGETYAFEFSAEPGAALSFATMFVPSNDLFFAPEPGGVRLFEGGEAISGNVTAQVALWDAGTEVNEEPGVGPNQVQNQPEPNTGPDENAPVREIGDVDDGFDYPTASDLIQVTVTPVEETATTGTVTTGAETTGVETTGTGTTEFGTTTGTTGGNATGTTDFFGTETGTPGTGTTSGGNATDGTTTTIY